MWSSELFFIIRTIIEHSNLLNTTCIEVSGGHFESKLATLNLIGNFQYLDHRKTATFLLRTKGSNKSSIVFEAKERLHSKGFPAHKSKVWFVLDLGSAQSTRVTGRHTAGATSVCGAGSFSLNLNLTRPIVRLLHLSKQSSITTRPRGNFDGEENWTNRTA